MNVALIKFAQSSEMKWCLTFEILRILKYILLATELTCFFIDKVASRTASKFFFYIGLRCYNCLTNLYADILQAALLVGTSSHNYFIFASFSLSLFTVIKDQTLAMQFP